MSKIIKREKWLFTIDLDGTLLSDSSNSTINKKDVKAIQALRNAGHVVCIVTGRPWRSTKKAYTELGLDTVVANYNGAQIHNPSDYNFNQIISYMNLNDVLYIIGDEKLKNSMTNLAIEGPGWVMLEHRDAALEKVFGFQDASKLRIGIDYHKLPLRPTGVIFDTKEGINILELKDYLQRTYGDLVEFSSWSKGEGLTPVFDMTTVGVTKAKAISLMARYYDIPIQRTASIGDGYNDVPMFQTTELSAAMKNASKDIQEIATYVTGKTNKDGGIADFVNRFLSEEDFVEKLIKKRKKIRLNKDNTVKIN